MHTTALCPPSRPPQGRARTDTDTGLQPHCFVQHSFQQAWICVASWGVYCSVSFVLTPAVGVCSCVPSHVR